MKRSDFPYLGHGVGLRPEHYRMAAEGEARIDWFEIISENFMNSDGRPLRVLEHLRERYPVVMHGVSMSLGSTDPIDRGYLARLAALARRFQPAWLSDHLCWTGVGGHNLHDLLPLPHTDEAVRHLASRIRLVQEVLGRPILIENISSYFSYTQSSMMEWEFLSAVADEADCGILLDINNIYVNSFNHGFDPKLYIDSVPVARVGQFHLAGYQDCGAYLLDSHDRPVSAEVWALYERAVRRFGYVSSLIEWDDKLPELAGLAAVADEARRRSNCRMSNKSYRNGGEG